MRNDKSRKKKQSRNVKSQRRERDETDRDGRETDASPKNLRKAQKQDEGRRERKGKSEDQPIAIVGIGASAGGLEALEDFFKQVKPGRRLAYVVVQHRAADKSSVMTSLLGRHTELDVEEITDGAVIRPDCVYLNPPHTEVDITDDKLVCSKAKAEDGSRLPIDHFFRSLAASRGERAICIVLSGTGSDGTLGLKEIKAQGGLTIVQDPEQARYGGMPNSAMETGQIDFVLGVEHMAEQVAAYVDHPFMAMPEREVPQNTRFERTLGKLFGQMRDAVGHDFSQYKRSTITRRLQHRMAIHQIDDMEQYIRFAGEHPDEMQRLFKDWTISVTSFFRGRDAFESLRKNAIEDIVANKPLDRPIRVWIPGCATGEEAYSVAILIDESLDAHDLHRDVQMFATDMDEDAIRFARAGNYPENIKADVSQERLNRFFVRSKSRYQIKQRIRENIVFARQDVIGDPPFSRLDLICCRNVLIYMGRKLQKHILPLFHFTLVEGGYLFLGNSETIGEFGELFEPVDTHNKLYRATGQHVQRPANVKIAPLKVRGDERRNEEKQEKARRSDRFIQQAERLILRDYSQPCVLVNDKLDVVYFNGETSAFLAQRQGEPTTNVLELARRPLHYELSILLHQVRKEKKHVARKRMVMPIDGRPANVTVGVRSLPEISGNGNLMIVVFEVDREKAGKDDIEHPQEKDSDENARVRELEQELASTKEYLQTTIEELETSNEELQSSNEELQSTNEELQSTNEELETSREELQSVNEELRTVNTAHEEELGELTGANDDLHNVLVSTDVATIFLDGDLKIRRFTPAAHELFNLIDSDIGRSLSDISHNLHYDGLIDDAGTVLETLREIEIHIECKNSRVLRVRITPYRTAKNVIDGVVLVALDVTHEARARMYAESIVDTVRCPLLVLDGNMNVLSANRAFYEQFQVAAEETEGKSLYVLGHGQWNIPGLRKLLDEILPNNSVVQDFEVEHDFPDIGKKKMMLNARRMAGMDAEGARILLAIEDKTEGLNVEGGNE